VTRQPVGSLPDIARLQPRQQMAMDCARCARPLGAGGQVWGEARYRGHLFRLWVCAPQCLPRPPGSAP
jgi:hypothetical protein